MRKSVVFFDIDGTLWDADNYIPPSTREAIASLRKNGHLAFINTGRCKGYVRSKELLSIGFDGSVFGCGTMIEAGEDTLLYHVIDQELAAYSIEMVRKHGFKPVLEGRYDLYLDHEEFKDNPYGRKLERELGEHLLSISDNWKNWEISKFSCDTEGCDIHKCFSELEEHYDFMVHNSSVTEFVPKGFNKGTGLLKVCELFGIDVSDSYAFGDSPNDSHMLEAAGHAVVMGSGNDETKKLAQYVTSGLLQDGILKGLQYYGLV